MKTKLFVAVTAVFVVSASSAFAQGYWGNQWVENFDSYADQAALNAVWTPGTVGMTLTTTNQSTSGANSIYQGTGAQQSRLYLGLEIPAAELDFSFSFYDGGAALGRTFGMMYARTGAGDWAGGLEQIVAIGKNNGIATTSYSARVPFGGGPNWFNLDGAPARSVGWHTARIVGDFGGGGAQYSFYIDNILGGTATTTTTPTFDWIVLGSGLSSSTVMWYDNVVVMVPEPSSVTLCLLGGLGLAAGAISRRRKV